MKTFFCKFILGIWLKEPWNLDRKLLHGLGFIENTVFLAFYMFSPYYVQSYI